MEKQTKTKKNTKTTKSEKKDAKKTVAKKTTVKTKVSAVAKKPTTTVVNESIKIAPKQKPESDAAPFFDGLSNGKTPQETVKEYKAIMDETAENVVCKSKSSEEIESYVELMNAPTDNVELKADLQKIFDKEFKVLAKNAQKAFNTLKRIVPKASKVVTKTSKDLEKKVREADRNFLKESGLTRDSFALNNHLTVFDIAAQVLGTETTNPILNAMLDEIHKIREENGVESLLNAIYKFDAACFATSYYVKDTEYSHHLILPNKETIQMKNKCPDIPNFKDIELETFKSTEKTAIPAFRANLLLQQKEEQESSEENTSSISSFALDVCNSIRTNELNKIRDILQKCDGYYKEKELINSINTFLSEVKQSLESLEAAQKMIKTALKFNPSTKELALSNPIDSLNTIASIINKTVLTAKDVRICACGSSGLCPGYGYELKGIALGGRLNLEFLTNLENSMTIYVWDKLKNMNGTILLGKIATEENADPVWKCLNHPKTDCVELSPKEVKCVEKILEKLSEVAKKS